MLLDIPQGSFELVRIPPAGNRPLQPWDGADTYLLEHLAEVGRPSGTALVVNDRFGALAVALAGDGPVVSWNDSVTSHNATVANASANGVAAGAITLVPSTESPGAALGDAATFAVVVIKVPRTLALLDEQLRTLRPFIGPDTVVVGGGMTRSIHNSTSQSFEAAVGPTTTSRARKKARLIHPVFDPDLDPRPMPETVAHQPDATDQSLAGDGLPLVDRANVFSRGRLDQGTRVLLGHLPTLEESSRVVDLGCGNGVLGLELARRHGSLDRLVMVDDSYHAVASARLNAAAWGLDSGDVQYLAARDLRAIEDDSIDLVLNNPPFHALQTRDRTEANLMFAEAARVLRTGGRLLVVGNRHLAYHRDLREYFGHVETIGSDPKFVVLAAVR